MNTSVDLTITDQNASSTARNIAGELDKVVTSADAINSAFDPKYLEDYSKELGKLTDQFSKLYKQQNENKQSQNTANGGISSGSSRLQSIASGASSALTGAGDVGGAGITGLSSLAKLPGGPGALLAGLGRTGAIVGNKLADQYEQRATPAGEQDSMQGQSSGNVEEIDKALAEAINSAFDPKYLEDYSKELGKLTDQFSKLYKQQNENNQPQNTANGGISSGSSRIQSIATGAGTALTRASGGDVGGAGITGLASIAKLFGGTGALLAGLGITGAMVGNKLADQYVQRATPAGELASMQGRLSGNLEENDKALNDAMQETVDSVTKYGKTYEEGIEARKAFLKAGGKDIEGSEAAAYSMAYKGENYGELSSFEGLLDRYGQKEGLKTTKGLLEEQGLEPAQFGEVMRGIEDVFTGFLGQGIIKDVTEIARSQEFLSRGGKTFQGGLGVQKQQTLNQAVAGSGNLQSQEDMIFYQAGRGLEGAGNLWDTKTAMEKEGFSPEFFKLLMAEYDKLGFTEDQAKMSFQKKTRVTNAAVNTVFGLTGEDATREAYDEAMKGKELPLDTGKTGLTGYTEDIENIKHAIVAGLGEEAQKARSAIVTGAADTVKSIVDIHDLLEENWDKRGEVAEKNLENQKVIEVENAQSVFSKEQGDQFVTGIRNSSVTGADELSSKIREAERAGVSAGDIKGAIGAKYKEFTTGDPDGTYELDKSELAELAVLLKAVKTATDETTVAVKQPMIVRGL